MVINSLDFLFDSYIPVWCGRKWHFRNVNRLRQTNKQTNNETPTKFCSLLLQNEKKGSLARQKHFRK
jgi:hypothetical protein